MSVGLSGPVRGSWGVVCVVLGLCCIWRRAVGYFASGADFCCSIGVWGCHY